MPDDTTGGPPVGATAPALIHGAQEAAAVDLPAAGDRTKGDLTTQFAARIEERWRIAQILGKSGMVREKRPEAIMAIQLKAFEMGLPLMQALSGMYFTDGKIALEGHLLDALAVTRCGVHKTVHVSTRTVCRMTLHRPGWDDLPVEFTIEDAVAAGHVAGYDPKKGEVTPAVRGGKKMMTWVKHTEEMLYWRALSKGLKRIAPDYFGGVYTMDEIGEAAEIHEAAGTSSVNAALDEIEEAVVVEDGGHVVDQVLEGPDDGPTEADLEAAEAEVRAKVQERDGDLFDGPEDDA